MHEDVSESDFTIIIEDGLVGRHLLVVELHGTVVEFGMLKLKQTDDFGTRPYGRTITGYSIS